MRIYTAIVDQDGRIVSTITHGPDQPQAFEGFRSVSVDGVLRGDIYWIDSNDAVALRPSLPVLPTAVGVEWIASNISPGETEVYFGSDLAATVPVVDGSVAITFGSPGRWRVVPPFPHLAAETDVS